MDGARALDPVCRIRRGLACAVDFAAGLGRARAPLEAPPGPSGGLRAALRSITLPRSARRPTFHLRRLPQALAMRERAPEVMVLKAGMVDRPVLR